MRKLTSSALALVLCLAITRYANAGSSLVYRFQHYEEDTDPIRVLANHAAAEPDVSTATKLSFRCVVGPKSRATPTAAPSPEGSSQPSLATLEDERCAAASILKAGGLQGC